MLESSRTTLNSSRLWLKPTRLASAQQPPPPLFHYLTTKDQTPWFLTNKVNFSSLFSTKKKKEKEQLENDILMSLAYQGRICFTFSLFWVPISAVLLVF